MIRLRNMTATLAGVALVLVLISQAQAQVIKKSNSGICHPPQSSYYERTKNFRSFESLQACLDSGGRLPANLPRSSITEGTAPSSALPQRSAAAGYERSRFGSGWDDADGDCQDSRAEALIASSTTTVRFADSRRCRVVTGRWISVFTGEVIQNASDIDIDHLVPLKWAWDRGAASWSQGQREKFANDPVNLLPVEASLNRSKGAQGPDNWLPPANQCGYVARFVRVVRLYDLTPTPSEQEAFQSILQRCR
mgnify:FL=1